MKTHDALIASIVLGITKAYSATALELPRPGWPNGTSRLKILLECERSTENAIRCAVVDVEYTRDQSEADFAVRVSRSGRRARKRGHAVTVIGGGRLAGIEMITHVGGDGETEWEDERDVDVWPNGAIPALPKGANRPG